MPVTKTTPDRVNEGIKAGSTFSQSLPTEFENVRDPPSPWVNSVTYSDNVPGWRQRIKARLDATTTMSGEHFRYNGLPDGYLAATRGSRDGPNTFYWTIVYRGNFQLAFRAPNQHDFSGDSSANNQAIQKIVQKVIDAQQSCQGLVSAGELGQTIRLIRRPLSSLFDKQYRYLDSVKKRTSRRAPLKTKLRVAADTWLEHSFGMLPLLSDIDGFAKAIASEPPSMRVSIPVRSQGSSDVCTPLGSEFVGSGFIRLKRVISRRDKQEIRYYGAVTTSNSAVGYKLAQFGIDLQSFIPSIYNLIPYSFLVDYVTNLGDFVEAACLNTSRIAWMNRGSKVTATTKVESVEWALTSPLEPYEFLQQLVFNPGTPSEFVSKWVNRQQYQGSYLPSLEFKLPINPRKWVNVAALGLTHSKTLRSFFSS